MKKFVLPLLALASLSTASAAERIGFFLLGGQYERDLNATDSFRVGLGLPLVGFVDGASGGYFSGDVAWLRHTRPLNAAGRGTQPYYGGGLGLAGAFVSSGGESASGLTIYPHVLGGANFGLNDRWALFAEGSVGANIYTGGVRTSVGSGSTSGVTVGLGLRLGATYRIR